METTTTTKTPWDFLKEVTYALLAQKDDLDKRVISAAEAEAKSMFDVVRHYDELRKDMKETYQAIIRSAERAIATIDQGFASLSHDELGSKKEDIVRLHAALGIRRDQMQVLAYNLDKQGINIDPFDFVV